MIITIVTEDYSYRAEQTDIKAFGSPVWRMSLNIHSRFDLPFEPFDEYFTSDVFDLICAKLAPIA